MQPFQIAGVIRRLHSQSPAGDPVPANGKTPYWNFVVSIPMGPEAGGAKGAQGECRVVSVMVMLDRYF